MRFSPSLWLFLPQAGRLSVYYFLLLSSLAGQAAPKVGTHQPALWLLRVEGEGFRGSDPKPRDQTAGSSPAGWGMGR